MDTEQQVERSPGALRPSGSYHALPATDVEVPSEIIREVAAGFKALAKVTPYDEYVSIVYRVARLKWRCIDDCTESATAGSVDGMDDHDTPSRDTAARLRRAALAYSSSYAELLTTRRTLLARTRLANTEAVQLRALSTAQRARLAHARAARATLREAVREHVGRMKLDGASLDAVLQETGRVVRRLPATNAIVDDQGALEAAVMRLAAEEYCTAA